MLPGNRKTHLIKPALVLERFRRFGILLKGVKCEIMVKETLFLGHQISRKGDAISPKKRVDFKDIRRPVTTTILRNF